MPDVHGPAEPDRDFTKMFDLDKSTAINNFVTRMEECMRQQQIAGDDLKQVCADATEAEFGPNDIRAMKKIAKLRLRDQLAQGREQLAALERIGRAVQFDLFDYGDNPKPPTH
jgi:hypothetical protein